LCSGNYVKTFVLLLKKIIPAGSKKDYMDKTIPSEEERLPFDPGTFVLGVFRRWPLFCLFGFLGLIAGFLATIVLIEPSYESETVLLFKPEEVPENTSLRDWLNTIRDTVKLPSNLELLRQNLDIDTSIYSLGRSIDVYVMERTQLLSISVSWDDPQTSALIANSLREIFLENQNHIRSVEAERRIKTLEARRERNIKALNEADAMARGFAIESRFVDIDKEAEWLLSQYNSLELQYNKTRMERDSVLTQKNTVQSIINRLREQTMDDDLPGTMDSVTSINVRQRVLRESISDERYYAVNNAVLAQVETEYKRNQELFKEGLISEAVLESSRLNYERQRLITIDSERVEGLKKQIADLDHQVINRPEGDSPAIAVLQQMMLKQAEIELQSVTLEDQVKGLEKLLADMRERLDIIPEIRRKYGHLLQELSSRESERQEIEAELMRALRTLDSGFADFIVVSEAKPPLLPSQFSKKIMFGAVFMLVFSGGFFIIIIIEAMDKTIKSAKEAQLKLELPILEEIPQFADVKSLTPENSDFSPHSLFSILARKVRRQVPDRGAKIMVVSALHKEGRSMLSMNLAACLGRQDERVLHVCADLRGENADVLKWLALREGREAFGLGEYLSYECDMPEDVISQTFLPGVECVPRVSCNVIPDLLGSYRMQEFLDGVSENYSVILIDGPPVLPYVDAQLLCKSVDAVLFVVKSRCYKWTQVRDAIERIRETGKPVFGVALNSVSRLYRSSDY
jgi:Mrp family chromosome partitioning ATPase/uncharacterized protein involved in exopolysaccharide biosynthesis